MRTGRVVVSGLLFFALFGLGHQSALGVASVRCTDSGTMITSPPADIVVTQAGLDVAIDVQTGYGQAVMFEDATGAQLTAGTVVGSTNGIVSTLSPGTWQVTCFDPDNPAQASGAGFAARTTTWTVLDPRQLFRPIGFVCPTRTLTAYPHPVGPRTQMAALVRADTWGIRKGDIVEAAGYPAARPVLMRLRRGSLVVALAVFEPIPGTGRVSLEQISQCQNTTKATRFMGADRGVRVITYATSSTLSHIPVLVGVARGSLPSATILSMRARFGVVCRTRRGTFVARSRLNLIDRRQLVFARQVSTKTTRHWTCEIRTNGHVVRRIVTKPAPIS